LISSFIQQHPFLTLLVWLLWQIPVAFSYSSLAHSKLKRILILTLTSICGGLGGSFGVTWNDLKNPRFQLASYTFAIFLGFITSGLLFGYILLNWLSKFLPFLAGT